jgi:hypothetical protein
VLGAAALALTAVALAAPSADAGRGVHGAGADQAVGQSAPTKSTARVLVRLSFPRCNACTVRMQKFADGRAWQSRAKSVEDHQVRFFVRRAHTVGSIFLIDAPGMRGLPYVPLIAMHYRGFDVGDAVSNPQARKARRGTPCWGGGSLRATVRSHRFPTQTAAGDPTTGIRAWAAVTLPKVGGFLRTDHGSVGTQDVVPCGASG